MESSELLRFILRGAWIHVKVAEGFPDRVVDLPDMMQPGHEPTLITEFLLSASLIPNCVKHTEHEKFNYNLSCDTWRLSQTIHNTTLNDWNVSWALGLHVAVFLLMINLPIIFWIDWLVYKMSEGTGTDGGAFRRRFVWSVWSRNKYSVYQRSLKHVETISRLIC